MSSRRVLKAAEAIREVVGMSILTELRDPRVENVTVTRVEVSPDMRGAKVYVSVMGTEAKQKLAVKGLESSAGYLQSRVADRIDTRYTPKLFFKLDDGVKKSIAIAKMLAEVLPPSDAAAALANEEDAVDDTDAAHEADSAGESGMAGEVPEGASPRPASD